MKNRGILLTSSIGLLIIIGTLFMMSYVQISAKSLNLPFYLSHNYIKLTNRDYPSVSIDVISDYNTAPDLVIISTDFEKQGFLGIYDPSMRYALINASSTIGKTRYFSSHDYVNGTRAGIVVSDSLAYLMEEPEHRKSPYVDEVMYYTDTQNILVENKNIKAIVNLFSFETLGSSIYIDYSSSGGQKSADNLKSVLLAQGYQVDKSETPSVIDALMDSNKTFLSTIMMGFVIFYVIYAIVSYWHFYNRKRELSIHYVLGGSFPHLLNRAAGPHFLISIVQFIIVYIFYRYQLLVNFTIMDFTTVLVIYLIHLSIVNMLNILAFGIVYIDIQATEGISRK